MSAVGHARTVLSSLTLLVLACPAGCASGDEASEAAKTAAPDSSQARGAGGLRETPTSFSRLSGHIDADPSSIVVTGPVTSGMGAPFRSAATYLGSVFQEANYIEEEYFYEGGAVSYALDGAMTADGKWKLAQESVAPYRTRLLVRRPSDPDKFNGTVIVEWLNVSAGADGDPGFMYSYAEILREGYAYVAVSAQQVGVQGGGFALGGGGEGRMPLRDADPERYGSLSHPGDGYSFDIFTRAARVIRGEAGKDIMGGLEPRHVLAYGKSQSAVRMVSYVDGVEPIAKAYDGYLIHSRSASGVPFGNSALSLAGGFGSTEGSKIRDDLEVPVLQLQTETDVLGMFGFVAARQPNTDKLVTWEIAGAAHADQYLLELGDGTTAGLRCQAANAGPQWYVMRAAVRSLRDWVADGKMPAQPAVLESSDNSAKLDVHGNVLGGLRTPDVDVPIAVLSGLPRAGSADFFCFLFGSTEPFSPAKLRELYPTHADYVAKFKASAAQARAAGWLLEADEAEIIATAEAAPIPE